MNLLIILRGKMIFFLMFLIFLSFTSRGQQPTRAGSPVSIETANQMIQNYLSIAGNDAVHSVFCDARLLRSYLQDSSISMVKFFFAKHASNERNASDSGRLTLVIAVTDKTGNYVLNGDKPVLEELQPCPTECPEGAAGSDLLPDNTRKQ